MKASPPEPAAEGGEPGVGIVLDLDSAEPFEVLPDQRRFVGGVEPPEIRRRGLGE